MKTIWPDTFIIIMSDSDSNSDVTMEEMLANGPQQAQDIPSLAEALMSDDESCGSMDCLPDLNTPMPSNGFGSGSETVSTTYYILYQMVYHYLYLTNTL
jgi:hypothetical protein